MNWFSAILARLATGMILALLMLLVLWLFVLPGTNLPTLFPAVMLFAPLLVGIGLALLLIDGWLILYWRKHWQPLENGVIPDGGEQTVRKVIRRLSGPAIFPPIADRLLARYLRNLATILLQRHERDAWAWDIYLLAWSHIRQNPTLMDETRAALKSSEFLSETAWRVGLALLKDRPYETGLAVRLARESMTRELSSHPADQLIVLEQSWIRAYQGANDTLKQVLLPPLTRRLLATRRRDEIAGRIFVDAFLQQQSSLELTAEMKRTADALESSGSDPELVATLRSLTHSSSDSEDADAEEVTQLFSPFGTREEAPPIESIWDDADNIQFEADSKDEPRIIAPEKKTPAKTAMTIPFDAEGREGIDQEGDYTIPPVGEDVKHGIRPWLIVAAALVILAVIGFGIYRALDSDETPAESQEPVQTAVQSELPYTLQVSALPTRERAVQMIRSLRRQNQDAYLVTTNQDNKIWYRVHLGHYASTEEATAYAQQLKTDGIIDDYYVARFEPGDIPPELTSAP
ncbi:SPOR domain-containing protein [bacterium]|nr:SPOR domain-containing protein [bacterium]